MKKLIMNTLLMIALTSCASYKTLYTMEDKGQPSWATDTTPYVNDDDYAYFVGVFETEYTDKTNINAVKAASESLAWAEVSKKVQNDLENNGELDISNGKNDIKLNAKQISKSVLSKAHVSDRWYKVIERKIDNKTRRDIIYYTRVQVSQNSYLEALNR